MSVYHEQYNVIHCRKHETLFLNKCLLHIYFSSGEVYLYRGISHNSIIHISSEVAHDVVRDSDKLLSYPYIQKKFKYSMNEALHYFYRFQIGNLIIQQTFYFVHCGFYFEVFKMTITPV